MTRDEIRSLMDDYGLNQKELAKLCCVAHTSVFKWLDDETVCAAIRPAPLSILKALQELPEERRKKVSPAIKKYCQPDSPSMKGLCVLLWASFTKELAKDALPR
jgi:hypothetical protein